MKRSFFLIIMACVLVFSSFAVAAKDDTIASLKTEYEVKNDGNVIVSASLVDIKDPAGLWGIVYYVKFDHTVLEYVNADINMPSKWESLVKSDAAEIFSYMESDGVYVWSVFCAMQGHGITADNEFTIDIEFKPLKKSDTSVNFECEGVYSDDESKSTETFKGESKKVSILLADKSNAGSSEGETSKDGSSSENSSASESKPSNENSNLSENSNVNDTSRNDNESSDDVNSENVEISDSLDDISEGETVDDISGEDISSDDSNAVNSVDNENSDTSLSEESNNGNGLLWVIIISFVIIAVGAVFIVFEMKKGKRK